MLILCVYKNGIYQIAIVLGPSVYLIQRVHCLFRAMYICVVRSKHIQWTAWVRDR